MTWFIKLQHSDLFCVVVVIKFLQSQTKSHKQLKQRNNGVKFMITCTFSKLGELMTDQVTGSVFSPYTWYIQFILWVNQECVQCQNNLYKWVCLCINKCLIINMMLIENIKEYYVLSCYVRVVTLSRWWGSFEVRS